MFTASLETPKPGALPPPVPLNGDGVSISVGSLLFPWPLVQRDSSWSSPLWPLGQDLTCPTPTLPRT